MKVQKHRIGGQDHVAHAGADGGHDDEGRLQAQRADQDVAVDTEHARKSSAVNNPLRAPMAADAVQIAAHQPKAQADGADL